MFYRGNEKMSATLEKSLAENEKHWTPKNSFPIFSKWNSRCKKTKISVRRP